MHILYHWALVLIASVFPNTSRYYRFQFQTRAGPAFPRAARPLKCKVRTTVYWNIYPCLPMHTALHKGLSVGGGAAVVTRDVFLHAKLYVYITSAVDIAALYSREWIQNNVKNANIHVPHLPRIKLTNWCNRWKPCAIYKLLRRNFADFDFHRDMLTATSYFRTLLCTTFMSYITTILFVCSHTAFPKVAYWTDFD